MIQLNLLPDLKKAYIQAQKTKALVITASILLTIGAVSVSVLLFLYVVFGQQIQINFINNDIASRTADLNSVTDLSKYLTIQNQLKSLPTLSGSKGIYSRLFDFLPVLNPNAPDSVELSSLSLSATGSDNTISIDGSAATFKSLNIFADTLTNAEVSYKLAGSSQTTTVKMFNSVVVQSSALESVNNGSLVTFTIGTVFNPLAFDVHNTNVVALVPNVITTQSVTGSPKVQVFGQSAGGK